MSYVIQKTASVCRGLDKIISIIFGMNHSRYMLVILLLGSGFLFGEALQESPHLTPEKVLGKVFPKDTFKDIQVAIVGYCSPAPIMQKYNPVNLTDQYFFLVPPCCVQVCTHNGIKFLSISHIYGGAPSSALVEDLAYYGIKYILAYGFAGGLGTKGVKGGDLYLVNASLVRDGTTPHYTKEEVVYPDAGLNQKILDVAQKNSTLGSIHSLKVMTDDAIYQEYEALLDEAVANDCDIVNLDCSHLFAVSNYVGIAATQFGVVSNARETAGEEKTEDLAKTLVSEDTSPQNPLVRVNDIVQFYVETLLPEL
jgi:uridine phosphorylase